MVTLANLQGSSLVPNIGQAIGQGLGAAQSLQNLQIQRQQFEAQQAAAQQEAARQAQLQGLLGQLGPGQQAAPAAGAPAIAGPPGPLGAPPLGVAPTQPGVAPAQPAQAGVAPQPVPFEQAESALRQLEVQFPEQAQQIAAARKANFDVRSSREKQRITSVAQGAAEIQGLPPEQQIRKLEQRRERLIRDKLPTNDTDQHLELLRAGRIDEANAFTDQAVQFGGAIGVLKEPTPVAFKEAELDIKRGTLEVRQEEQRQRTLDREINRETNTIKRLELEEKLEASKRKASESRRSLDFEAENAVGAVDDTTNTIDRLLQGTGLEAAAGISAVFPTIPGSRAADFEAQLETLQSQAFLSQVEKMKGLGALSENEGKKLAGAIGALSLTQSDETLRRELNRIKDTLQTAKQRLNKKFDIITPGSASELSDDELSRQLGL